MVRSNSPNTLKSKNRLTPKDIAKRTAALTLLLSTVACTSPTIEDLICYSPIIFIGGLFTLSLLADPINDLQEYFNKKYMEKHEHDTPSHHDDNPNGF